MSWENTLAGSLLLSRHGVETLLLTDILANDSDSLNYIRYRPNMTYTRDLATVFASAPAGASPLAPRR